MHYKYLIPLILLSIIAGSSCQKDSIIDNDLPVIDGNVVLNIVSNYRKPSNARNEPNYIFTDVKIAVDQITFLKKETNSSNPDFEGPFICDLIENTTEPQLPYGNIDEGNYQLFQLDIISALDSSLSIDIHGNYHPNGVVIHPFHYSTTIEESISIINTMGIDIIEDSLHQVSIVVDLAYIFDGVDYESAYYEEDGFLDFNAEGNLEHHEGITNRFLEGFSMYQLK
ncbi:hypothetical protein [Flammeovirga sp. SJP92]|uniref:hypothetical protein n=1 Tax=Flammeovirga sp. SJP92 TaxID=1775430 RepID=UPI00078725F5|nr:hypothetical protein [Flammeovirga sp. SJP92]KXX70656.1 hypothetical protein AVL50_07485 [Flammeovirga sp. SJP92]